MVIARMAETLAIAQGSVVSIHYTLRSPEGDVLDSSDGGEPLMYLHGADNIVPGLERELTGRKVGDSLEVEVKPVDAYGERQGPGPQRVPLTAFPEGARPEEGMQVFAEGPDNQTIPLWVVSVEDDAVMVDVDHPLAGMTLHFQVEVASVRTATDEELAHGHPHGPGGHHHH